MDTVGCGDSFAAAIVMGFINGWAPDVTLGLANAVSRRGRGRRRRRMREGANVALREGGSGGG